MATLLRGKLKFLVMNFHEGEKPSLDDNNMVKLIQTRVACEPRLYANGIDNFRVHKLSRFSLALGISQRLAY